MTHTETDTRYRDALAKIARGEVGTDSHRAKDFADNALGYCVTESQCETVLRQLAEGTIGSRSRKIKHFAQRVLLGFDDPVQADDYLDGEDPDYDDGIAAHDEDTDDGVTITKAKLKELTLAAAAAMLLSKAGMELALAVGDVPVKDLPLDVVKAWANFDNVATKLLEDVGSVTTADLIEGAGFLGGQIKGDMWRCGEDDCEVGGVSDNPTQDLTQHLLETHANR